MTEDDTIMTGCPRAEDAASWVRGELTAAEAAAFESHLATCAACRELTEGFRKVVEGLQARPAESVSHDLTGAILERIPAEAWTDEDEEESSGLRLPLLFSPVMLRVAAVFFIACSAGFVVWFSLKGGVEPAALPPVARAVPPKPAPPATRVEAISGALDWLASAQESAGSWDPARWGGKKDYEVSLTSMALLAFLKDKESLKIPANEQAAERGLEFLLKQQADSGMFGPECTGTMYNQGMATLAILEAYRLKDGPRLKAAVDSAVGFICRRQDDGGGWGYQKNSPQKANTSITAWQMKALFTAWQSGWKDTDVSLKKGLAWLHSVVDEQGLFGYQRPKDSPEGGSETLTAMGALCFFLAEEQGAEKAPSEARIKVALKSAATNPGKQQDFYRWYFVASALSAGREEGYDQLLADLQNLLIRERSRDSTQAGSWDPVGRWSSAGGRLYTTTMATLSLQEQAPGGGAM